MRTIVESFTQNIDEILEWISFKQVFEMLGIPLPLPQVGDVVGSLLFPDERPYFMFPLETVAEIRDKIKAEARESQAVIGSAFAVGLIPGAGDAASVAVSLGAVEYNRFLDILQFVQSTMDPKISLAPTTGGFLVDLFRSGGRPDDRRRYAVILPKQQVKHIRVKVEQEYSLESDMTGTGDVPIWTAAYETVWDLENSVLAAPGVHPVALVDYLPFQLLSLEVQEFLRRYFSVFVNAEAWHVPEETSLLPNYPNPFNPWIPYQLAESVDVKVSIYTIGGRLVRTLALGRQGPGVYWSRGRAAYWDGKNDVGEPVASGVYFYTLTAGEFTATRKMLIQK